MHVRDVNIKGLWRDWPIPVALCLIVVLGATLRLYGLRSQSLWNDELSAWARSSYESPAQVIDLGVRPDVHPPGYQILLYFVMEAFGDGEAVLRLPSAIIGILSVLAIYFLGAYIYTPKEGVLAAALMAALWTPLYYSQEARPYSLLLLMSILSSLAWFRLARDVQLQQQLRWSSIALYVLVATATCYIHYYGLLLIFFQGLYLGTVFARRRNALGRVGIAYLAILALYAPWLPDLFADFVVEETWIPRPTVYSLLSYAGFLFGNSLVLVLLAAEAFGLLIWTRLRAVRRPIRTRLGQRLLDPTIILLIWLTVPVSAAFLKSLVSTPVFTDRNLIICLPAAYLLLAHFVFVLPGSMRISPTLLSVGAVLLSFGLAAEVILRMDYYSGIHKQ
ncbi:MAG: glycosyltransferase family 39 protein, partial [Anaerolineae bacterium]